MMAERLARRRRKVVETPVLATLLVLSQLWSMWTITEAAGIYLSRPLFIRRSSRPVGFQLVKGVAPVGG